jgi:aspartokinase
MEKVKLGGLKQSLELCQFDLTGSANLSENMVWKISTLLASQKINIELLTYNLKRNNNQQLTLCTSQDTCIKVSKLLGKDGCLSTGWRIHCREHVGVLTLFPHHSVLKILGIVIASWASQSIPIYGITTSLSAISFITDYHRVDLGINAIQNSFQLPDNHAPIKPELLYYQSDMVKKRER